MFTFFSCSSPFPYSLSYVSPLSIIHPSNTLTLILTKICLPFRCFKARVNNITVTDPFLYEFYSALSWKYTINSFSSIVVIKKKYSSRKVQFKTDKKVEMKKLFTSESWTLRCKQRDFHEYFCKTLLDNLRFPSVKNNVSSVGKKQHSFVHFS